MPIQIDTSLLQAALIGYEAERQTIQAKIAELQAQLKGGNHRGGTPVAPIPTKRSSRHLSTAARKRIAEAQRKRWAAFHRKQKSV